ncbi:MAG: hypothetical protein IJQ81_08585, partial [Oscillibacter sp.]|nr:hypothetical protein [Oscillibacter sp.]
EEEEEDAEGTAEPLDMLYKVMLPFASVDETVRSGGSYVIRYQKNPALVLEVFYVAQSGRFSHTFTNKDFSSSDEQDSVWSYSGSTKKGLRQHYGADDAVIGWYGAEGGELPDLTPGDPLNPPVITVTNAERLYVDISNPNASIADAKLHLIIKGLQSGKECTIELINDGSLARGSGTTSDIRVVLDDVTSDKQIEHFYQACEGRLYPGEDIVIYAEAYNNNKLTNIARSADATTNSLFADSLKPIAPFFSDSHTFAAYISNFRHLENLDRAISKINAEKLGNVRVNGEAPFCYFLDENKRQVITGAIQSGNMDWLAFMAAITGKNVGEEGSKKVQVYRADTSHSEEGCYLPITNDGTIAYDGNNKKIANVEINISENAGLFATLGHHSSVTNLKLVNFSVKSSGNNKATGALAGVLDNSNVTGVLAHHDTGDTLPEANKWIDGQTSVGGLIGEITGACTVEQSAAAVYVKSSTTNGDAGGLIGKITSGSNVTVRNSYAGGHVISKDTDGNPIVATYDKVNCNVTGKNAGGLIGSSSAGTLKVLNCYATTSADGSTNAGGLIGSMTGGTIENCYATGYVKDSEGAGAFIGELKGTLNTDTNKENSYFSTVTEGLDPVRKATGVITTDISPWDTNPKAYGVKNAMPYDEYLQRHYTNGKHSLYTFRTISELNSGVTSPGWMTTHYGDWPPLDTLVIND